MIGKPVAEIERAFGKKKDYHGKIIFNYFSVTKVIVL